MDLKVDFTPAEAGELLGIFKTDDNIVRLVDPVSQRVVDVLGNIVGDETCSTVWGRCERCENCTSLRALDEKSVYYKMELIDDRTFWVISRYLRIDGQPRILEVVTDTTDSLIMDTDKLDKLGQIIQSYNHLLITDSLTGVYNRRYLDDYFVPSLSCCHDREVTVNVAMMDVDHFKLVNDTYGHRAGDALLKDVAGFWRRRYNSREKNRERLVVRYGGDELLLIMSNVTPEAFREDVELSYEHMRKFCYYSPEVSIPFSITFGLASSTECEVPWTWEDLFGLADKRLYENKRA